MNEQNPKEINTKTRSSAKSNKTSLSDRILNNPALISSLAGAVLIFLVSVFGLDQMQATNAVNLVLYFLSVLGVGGVTGLAIRGNVVPTRKLDK